MTKKSSSLPLVEQLTVCDDSGKSPIHSHITTGDYVALMETNGKECESWYYFIRYKGNEEALKYLQDQLEQVEWYVVDDLSVFDLDLDHFVTAQTAKQMTKLELNSYAFHRKFDGVLQKINLGFRTKDKNEKKICKAFDQLGYSQIEDYIDDEDLDDEDLTENESDSDEEDSDSDKEEDPSSSVRGLPPLLLGASSSKHGREHRHRHRQ